LKYHNKVNISKSVIKVLATGTNSQMSNYSNLPAPSPEHGLSRYLQQIRKFPMLEPQEEFMLAKRWVDHEDTDAAHKLVTSHLRLAAKIAMGYRGYGLPQSEIISEANVGLMQAVKKFDPDKGFRLATYAMWWIRASIQEYVLRSWSLVKMGTTSAQKKLFFNLRKAKNRIGAFEEGDLRPENKKQIASELNVDESEVESMNRRMSGTDASLNAVISVDGENTSQWQDWLEDENADQAADYAEKDEFDSRKGLLLEALEILNDRERDILSRRRLSETVSTLEELSLQYGISRERVRQLEVRAFEKLQIKMRSLAEDKGMI
jgi:RNA polymerase sigma-32 factor